MQIQDGLTNTNALELTKIETSDKAFSAGMPADKNVLNDPAKEDWESPFKEDNIHGVLKVAGNTPEQVTAKLNAIKGILGDSASGSNVEGKVRPKDLKLNGHEQYESLTCCSNDEILTLFSSASVLRTESHSP